VPADGTADGTDDDRPPPLPDGVGAATAGVALDPNAGAETAEPVGVGFDEPQPATMTRRATGRSASAR